MASQKFDSHSPIAASKQQWRAHLKKIRQELPANRYEEASSQACQRLSKMCQSTNRLILSFASFGSEINLWPLNQSLCNDGRLVLPAMTATKELLLFLVTHLDQLELHPWGMLEPNISVCQQADPSLIEIALIPGLGFDPKTKYRLGYGQGFYDRMLIATSFVQTWGIGFLEQAVEGLPYSKDDIPLNQIYLF
jgi:5-formyltetrahydrofolate cyclo-ligase